jgi:enoyl-CoA hydratase
MPLFTGARKPADEWDERLLANLGSRADRAAQAVRAVQADHRRGERLCARGRLRDPAGDRSADRVAHGELRLSEAQRGLVPGGGSMVRLARQVPHCKAMEILLLGDRMPAPKRTGSGS